VSPLWREKKKLSRDGDQLGKIREYMPEGEGGGGGLKNWQGRGGDRDRLKEKSGPAPPLNKAGFNGGRGRGEKGRGKNIRVESQRKNVPSLSSSRREGGRYNFMGRP